MINELALADAWKQAQATAHSMGVGLGDPFNIGTYVQGPSFAAEFTPYGGFIPPLATAAAAQHRSPPACST